MADPQTLANMLGSPAGEDQAFWDLLRNRNQPQGWGDQSSPDQPTPERVASVPHVAGRDEMSNTSLPLDQRVQGWASRALEGMGMNSRNAEHFSRVAKDAVGVAAAPIIGYDQAERAVRGGVANGDWKTLAVDLPLAAMAMAPGGKVPGKIINGALETAGKLGGEAAGKAAASKVSKEALADAVEGTTTRAVSAKLPSLRGQPVDDAIAVARNGPHLIPKSGGGFVGAPQDIKSLDDLAAQRAKMDANLSGMSEYADGLKRAGHDPSNATAEDVRAALWYERAKTSNKNISQDPTNPRQQMWNSRIDAEFSPGTDPGPEFNAATGARNSSIANEIKPVFEADGVTPKPFNDRIDRIPGPDARQEMSGVRQTARPLQAQNMANAIMANDPSMLATGKKTGQYGAHMNPGEVTPGATGVGDFRWFNELGFTNPDGTKQSAGNHLTGKTNHTWGDYETALATDRARGGQMGHNGGPPMNEPLHGRTDWTGEQVQALGWVRQKAQDLQDAAGYKWVDTPWGPQQMHKMSWDDAMKRANMTPFDSAPRQTFFAVHEPTPGLEGHLPGIPGKSQSVQDAYSDAATWRDKNNKDILYGALHPKGAPDVRMTMDDTIPARGVWGDQFNKAEVARPHISYQVGGGEIAEPDQRIIRAVEGTRGLIDAQAMSGGHVVIPSSQAKAGEMSALRIPMDRPLSIDEARNVSEIGARYGRPHVSDTGKGVTVTDWNNSELSGTELGKTLKKGDMQKELAGALEGMGRPERQKVQSVMFEFPPSAEGSGARTKAVVDELKASPNLYRSLNESADIPKKALANLQRDEAYIKANPDQYRKDQMNLLKIISEGPGWLDRIAKGGFVPAALLTVMAGRQQPAEE